MPLTPFNCLALTRSPRTGSCWAVPYIRARYSRRVVSPLKVLRPRSPQPGASTFRSRSPRESRAQSPPLAPSLHREAGASVFDDGAVDGCTLVDLSSRANAISKFLRSPCRCGAHCRRASKQITHRDLKPFNVSVGDAASSAHFRLAGSAAGPATELIATHAPSTHQV